MTKLTEKWKQTGLLENLTDEQSDELSPLLESVVNEILALGEPKTDIERSEREQFAGRVIPLVRRIYDEIYPKKFPDIKWLTEDFSNFTKSNQELFDNLISASYIAMDGEAEFISLYCEDFKKRNVV